MERGERLLEFLILSSSTLSLLLPLSSPPHNNIQECTSLSKLGSPLTSSLPLSIPLFPSLPLSPSLPRLPVSIQSKLTRSPSLSLPLSLSLSAQWMS